MADPQRLLVAAAVIERDDRFLVTRRPAGAHLAGYWEFPGGKCESGESPIDCLTREIREELQAEVIVGEEIYSTSHQYPERLIELRFYRCDLTGQPRAALGQEMQWMARVELRETDFPPADAELIARLKE